MSRASAEVPGSHQSGEPPRAAMRSADFGAGPSAHRDELSSPGGFVRSGPTQPAAAKWSRGGRGEAVLEDGRGAEPPVRGPGQSPVQIPSSVDEFRRMVNRGLEAQGHIAAWRPPHPGDCQGHHEKVGPPQWALQLHHRRICELVHDGNDWRRAERERSPLTDELDGWHYHTHLQCLTVPKAPSRKHCHQRNPSIVTVAPYRAVGPQDATALPELEQSAPATAKPVRRRMYQLRDALRPLGRPTAVIGHGGAEHQVSRIGVCGHATTATARVGVVMAPSGRARYSGIVRCGSVWECPVCALHIKTHRAEEVRRVVELHGSDRCVMLTVTVRHGLGDDLRMLRRRLADAWRGMTRGAAWARCVAELGIVGSIRALEVTHGANGWHPHLHVVLLLRNPPDQSDLLEVDGSTEWLHPRRGWLIDRWIEMCRRYMDPAVRCRCGAEYTAAELRRCAVCRCGADLAIAGSSPSSGRAVPDEQHGISLTALGASDYLAKLGLEVTHPGKRGRRGSRTPLEIADDWARWGRARDARLWRTYCAAMVGARQMTWSRDLRRRFGLRERTDLELATEDEPSSDDRIIATIPLERWRIVRSIRGATARILEAAERGGRSAVHACLDRLARDGPDGKAEIPPGSRGAGDHDGI